MATSTATRKRIQRADDIDETPEDHADLDLPDLDDDTEDDDYDDSDDSDSAEEGDEEGAGDEDSADSGEQEDEPAPELRDYYLDVSLKENGDGTKRKPFNTAAALKGVRLAPGATLFVRSRTTVEALEIKGYRYAASSKEVRRMKLASLKIGYDDLIIAAVSILWVAVTMLLSSIL